MSTPLRAPRGPALPKTSVPRSHQMTPPPQLAGPVFPKADDLPPPEGAPPNVVDAGDSDTSPVSGIAQPEEIATNWETCVEGVNGRAFWKNTITKREVLTIPACVARAAADGGPSKDDWELDAPPPDAPPPDAPPPDAPPPDTPPPDAAAPAREIPLSAGLGPPPAEDVSAEGSADAEVEIIYAPAEPGTPAAAATARAGSEPKSAKRRTPSQIASKVTHGAFGEGVHRRQVAHILAKVAHGIEARAQAGSEVGSEADAPAAGTFSFIYRYILRELCSQFDSLPLTSLTISPDRLGSGALDRRLR